MSYKVASRLPRTRPLLYLISNRLAPRHNPEIIDTEIGPELKLLQIDAQIDLIREAARAGCRLIQIREKDLSAQELVEMTRKAVAAARPFGAKVLVNDRLDVAIAAGADGVHLRVESLPVKITRNIVERVGLDNFLIGVSTHSLTEARAAESEGADFIVCGPVYETPSKKEYGRPIGPELFGEICRSVEIPKLAIGGISLSNFREPLRLGADGIAAIGLFNNKSELSDRIKTILGYEF